MASQIPSIKLSDGSQIPMLGLGTYDSLDEKELTTAVKAAINAGYRHFDCGTLCSFIFLFFSGKKIIIILKLTFIAMSTLSAKQSMSPYRNRTVV